MRVVVTVTIKPSHPIGRLRAIVAYTEFLRALGYEVEAIPSMASGPSGKNTAVRAVDAWIEFLTKQQDHFSFTAFDCEPKVQDQVSPRDVVALTHVEFMSLCCHHWLPIIGEVHVAYVPKGRVCGLSKIVRVVDHYSHRPTVQEELGGKIATFIQEQLDPLGVMVVIEAVHMCMAMRGVNRPNHKTVTSSSRGCFNEVAYRAEFLSMIRDRP